MIRGLWTSDTVGWLLVAAGAPAAVALFLDQGVPGLARLGMCLALVFAWQVVFRFNLGVPLAPASAVAALAVALIAPPGAPLWQVAVAISFGVVIGELVFGGWGRHFLSAGTVALAFLSLSVPNAVWVPAGDTLFWAVLPGAALLLVAGILPLALVVAYAAALAAVAAALGLDEPIRGGAGTLAFAAVFLAADPVAAGATAAGRWIQGAVAGALTALLATGTSLPQAAVFAILLAALFAPLVDQGVIALHFKRRRARRGRA